MSVVTVFEQHAQEYDKWFDAHEPVYRAELAALRKLLPTTGLGLEVGVGTGRFAVPLGIPVGIDPSRRMLTIARTRGLRVCQAVGERLPFRDGQFDFVLIVTVICFVDDVATLLQELVRVLKSGGHLVIGFIDRNSELGRRYGSRKEASDFYRDARFYSVEEVADRVKRAGFDVIRFCQTLLGGSNEYSTDDLENREGCGVGAFVVLGATKTTG